MNESQSATAPSGGLAEVRAYVNERGVSVPPGSTALDAVQAFSPELAEQVAAGAARLTDSRGLPLEATHPVHGGLILRVLPVRTRAQVAHEEGAQ
jgi:hypothetical protein